MLLSKQGNLLHRVEEQNRLLESTKKTSQDATRRLDQKEDHLANLENKLQQQADSLKKMEQQHTEWAREVTVHNINYLPLILQFKSYIIL